MTPDLRPANRVTLGRSSTLPRTNARSVRSGSTRLQGRTWSASTANTCAARSLRKLERVSVTTAGLASMHRGRRAGTAPHRRTQLAALHHAHDATPGLTARSKRRRCACSALPERSLHRAKLHVTFALPVNGAASGTLLAHHVLQGTILPQGTTAQSAVQGRFLPRLRQVARLARQVLFPPSARLRASLANPERTRMLNRGRASSARQGRTRRRNPIRVVLARAEKCPERALPLAKCAQRGSTRTPERSTFANLVPAAV